MLYRFGLYILIFLVILGTGCKGFFGEKTDLSFIETPKGGTQSTEAYIPILPSLQGFSDPSDVLAGFDQLIYVVDKGANKIISYDQAGKKLSEYTLQGVKAIAQDRRLNLLALASMDTLLNNTSYKFNAVFRLNMYQNGVYSLANAQITKKIIHPFYFKTSVSVADAQTEFKDIAVLDDNSYYVTRSGNRNSGNQFGGPDNAVLMFNSKDEWQGIISVRTNQGTLNDYFKSPFSIVTEAQPPIGFSTKVSSQKGFFISMLDPNLTLKVQAVSTEFSDQGLEYVLNTGLASNDTAKASGFIYTANKFKNPLGLAYQYDASEYFFVADADKDSVYQFSKSGLEGVAPQAGTGQTKFIKVSFGGTGTGPMNFRNPVAVATANRTLYVVDAGNKRVTRFRLTRDME